MSKFNVGDRVAVYDLSGRTVGVVIEILDDNKFKAYRESDRAIFYANPKQCRKLVKNLTRSRVDDVLKYCQPHIDKMWAANVAGYLLNCDFRDASQKLKEYLEKKNE